LYREKLKQSLEVEQASIDQDEIQKFALSIVPIKTLTDKVLLDVGCGAGSLLNITKDTCGEQVGIEPCQPYRKALIAKGYNVFQELIGATKFFESSVDYAFSIQVIEHVENPRNFLEEIKQFLKPGGSVLISTPNRDEILMNILHKEFSSFFYRTQHRWYFNEESLINCAKLSGFEVELVSFIHRQPMSNALYWLRDKAPKGSTKMDGISLEANNIWRSYLEKTKQSCTIFLKLKLIDK